MRRKGLIRQVDQLGRIVLPVTLRQYFDIGFKDQVEIFNDGNYILIQKYKDSCFLCGSTEQIIAAKTKMICAGCIEEFRSLPL